MDWDKIATAANELLPVVTRLAEELQASAYGIADVSSQSVLRTLTAAMVDAIPDEFLALERVVSQTRPKPTETARSRECARHFVTLREAILAQIPLDDDARRRVREDPMVAVPFRRK